MQCANDCYISLKPICNMYKPLDWENQEEISAASCWDLLRESRPPHWFCTAIWRPFHRDKIDATLSRRWGLPQPSLQTSNASGFWRVEAATLVVSIPRLPSFMDSMHANSMPPLSLSLTTRQERSERESKEENLRKVWRWRERWDRKMWDYGCAWVGQTSNLVKSVFSLIHWPNKGFAFTWKLGKLHPIFFLCFPI